MSGINEIKRALETDWSSDHFKMEYMGYRSNHLVHGVVALLYLGATKDRIEYFVKEYSKRLEHQKEKYDECVILTPDESINLLGKRHNFRELLHLYENEITCNGVDRTLKQYLPLLIHGLAGSLFHGIIQLGYGYSIGVSKSIAEGLAYLHYSFISFEATVKSEPINKQGEGTVLSKEQILRIVQRLVEDVELRLQIQAQLEWVSDLKIATSDVQKKIIAVSAHSKYGNLQALNRIATEFTRCDFTLVNVVLALDFILWLYTMLNCNDFVVVHLITSAWSLGQIEHLLTPDYHEKAWKAWIFASCASFISREDTEIKYNHKCENSSHNIVEQSDDPPTWGCLLEKTFALNNPDVHVYKVVQVALSHSRRKISSVTECFLSREERDLICRRAAFRVLNEEFVI
jgi:hypothetical protein